MYLMTEAHKVYKTKNNKKRSTWQIHPPVNFSVTRKSTQIWKIKEIWVALNMKFDPVDTEEYYTQNLSILSHHFLKI